MTRPMTRREVPRGELWRSPHLPPLILFAVCSLFLFRLSLFAGWTFIGDADRLNSVLNTRFFEVLSLHQRGTIPAWSDQQFMGYSVVGLHWMLTTFSPVPYVLALLPTAGMLPALAAFSAVMLFLTLAATYWMLGAYSASPLARTVGAILFGLGSYTVHKLLQLDLSFAALTMMPVLMLLVRATRRATAARMFLALALSWAFVALYTVLQEIAYIAMLYSSYALYRSVRLRDGWPVMIGALAFICGVAIASSRILTVAVDIPDVARSSMDIPTAPFEVLRYFGDGLLGRNQDENDLVRGGAVNTHEGVQLLMSSAGAWAAILAGLLARSGAARGWGIGLFLVLSVAFVSWWRPFYDSVGRFESVSREFRVVVMNAVLMGVPLWLVCWGLARRTPSSPATSDDDLRTQETPELPAAVEDAPYFLLFAALGLAAIVIPEGHALLYYGFFRLDFLHSRLSVAISLPLVALATILVSRFLPARLDGAAVRWLGGGLAVAVGLWLLREAGAQAAVARFGVVLEELRPRRLITIETVRVMTSLLVVLAACAVLVLRGRVPHRTLAGGLLAGWIALEAISAADFRMNGPQTWGQSGPFAAQNYLNVPPGGFQVPTAEQRAVVRDRLEADTYRSVMLRSGKEYAALVEPHLAAFWNLRLVEGYSTGIPRRLQALPWQENTTSPHNLNLDDAHQPPWQLLAALNVKYMVTVDRSLWFNAAPGAGDTPMAVDNLTIRENPFPVAPRAFFTARITPAGNTPRLIGDDGTRPPPFDPPIADPRMHSVVEGLDAERVLSTAGTLDATFDGDRVTVRLSPLPEERFLVLNERYYAGWQAWTDGRPAEILPTNLAMRGVLVPAGTTLVEFQFVPFLATPAGILLLAGSIAATGVAWYGVRWAVRRTDSPARTPPAG